jgi:hypothetical protein
MTIVVNLAMLHDYSLKETIGHFAEICNRYSTRSVPSNFFQSNFHQAWLAYNKAWVVCQLNKHNKTLIEPYKLGQITTSKFLRQLSLIFDFLPPMAQTEKDAILIHAWNQSIKANAETRGRLALLINKALSAKEPVYLVSNTNELNMREVAKILKAENANLNVEALFAGGAKQSGVKLANNFYFLGSYQTGQFKFGKDQQLGMLASLMRGMNCEVTFVGSGTDLERARALGMQSISETAFFGLELTQAAVKKID